MTPLPTFFVLPSGVHQDRECVKCGKQKCGFICRALGCAYACCTGCFKLDQDLWPSIIGEGKGVCCRPHDDMVGLFVCPECAVQYVYRHHEDVSDDVWARALRLEQARIFFFYQSRADGTVSNLAVGVRKMRRFESEMGVPLIPSLGGADDNVLQTAWLVVEQAQTVKVQSLDGLSASVARG